MKEIDTIDSQIVYQNKWMTVREDKIRRASGAEGIYGVVDKPDFAVILAFQDGDVYLVEQYRYAIGERQAEFPQGTWESNPEADHLLLAAGELQEETGLRADKMEYIGFQYLAYGFCSQGYHIYFATDLTQGDASLDPEEEGLTSRKVSVDQLEEMILSGEIKDSTTVNVFALARLKGLI